MLQIGILIVTVFSNDLGSSVEKSWLTVVNPALLSSYLLTLVKENG